MHNDGIILRITLEEYERTGNDFKGTYMDYQGVHPEWKGRKTFVPPLGDESGHYATCLLIEGVSFVIEDDGYDMDAAAREALRREEDASYKNETFRKLCRLADDFTSYPLFNNACDDIMLDYIKHYREFDGESFFRPTRASQVQRMIPYAFEQSHKGSMYKRFCIAWSFGCERTGYGYGLNGETAQDEQDMKVAVAKRYDTTPDMVYAVYEQEDR